MKPRKMILFFALIVAIFSASPATQSRTTISAVGTAPDVVAEEFYKWYIHSVSHQIDPLKAGKPTLQKYVTPRFMRKLERIAREMASGDYDGDYFLEAQRDYPDSPNLEDEWIKNISTSKLVVKGAPPRSRLALEKTVLSRKRGSASSRRAAPGKLMM